MLLPWACDDLHSPHSLLAPKLDYAGPPILASFLSRLLNQVLYFTYLPWLSLLGHEMHLVEL